MNEKGAVDCSAALRELYVFLDGELTPERRQLIRYHLDECGHCGSTAVFEAELRHVISARCRRDPVPESLRAKVAQLIADLDQEG